MSIIADINKKFSIKVQVEDPTPEVKGTFVGLRPSPESITRITELLQYSQIKNYLDPADYHLTLFYSKDEPIENFEPKSSEKYQVKVVGTGKLGDALVIFLESEKLLQRHQEIKDQYNAVHSFPDLLPHISVKYNPDEFDEEMFKQLFIDHSFYFENEYSEIANPMG